MGAKESISDRSSPDNGTSTGTSTGNSTGNSTGTGTTVALRTEEEQQAAARERENRERTEMEKEINDRREARRKSLANRRVSFAAEATLHTFHEIEYMQDSTTSTASTGRPSSVAAETPRPQQEPPQQQDAGSAASEPPSTPADHIEQVSESLGNQRDLHQGKHRRSSEASQLAFNNREDDTMNTAMYSSDSENADGVAEIQEAEDMSSSMDSDEEDGTMMTVEAEEMTSASVASGHFDTSAESTGGLDENLRLAAQRASAHSSHEDEEVIAGFAGWGKRQGQAAAPQTDRQKTMHVSGCGGEDAREMDMDTDMDMEMEMEITAAVGGIIHRKQPAEEEEEDMSMDVTHALGGIIAQSKQPGRRKSGKPSVRPVTEDDSIMGDAPMDLTMPVGGIQQGRASDGSLADTEVNEDMSMELTTAVGGVLSEATARFGRGVGRRRTIQALGDADADADASDDDETPMEMTTTVGQILPCARDDEDDDQDADMDITTIVGGIIKPSSPGDARSAAKKVMEKEADQRGTSITASLEIKSPLRKSISAMIHDAGSPGLAGFQGKGLRRSAGPSHSPTWKSATTPQRRRVTNNAGSPTRTRSPAMGTLSSSPMRYISPNVKTTPRSPTKSKTPERSLFRQDPKTGNATPSVVLTPLPRRMSGVGLDRPGLGSPRVTEILARRASLGDASPIFVPGAEFLGRRTVVFADPRALEEEIDKERQDEEDKENKRKIPEREADGCQDDKDATLNLKEMISSLSPAKKPFKGRKSLHVGSAKGLLGKRPAELDEQDEAEEMDGMKRLKGHPGSPVKNVHLRSPPSKAETTTGRKTRASMKSADDTDTDTITPSTQLLSPTRTTTPSDQGRFKKVEHDQATGKVDCARSPALVDADMHGNGDDDEERIHLQDFLNMTSIRFMELTTTKRRHTGAPTAPRDSTSGDDDMSMERCVVAGACTVPMLELYQHVSLHTVAYIVSGRSPPARLSGRTKLTFRSTSPAASSRNTSRKAAASCAKSRRNRLRKTHRFSASTCRRRPTCAC